MTSQNNGRVPWSKNEIGRPIRIHVQSEHNISNEDLDEASRKNLSGIESRNVSKERGTFNRNSESKGLMPNTHNMDLTRDLDRGDHTFGIGTVPANSDGGLQRLLKQRQKIQSRCRKRDRNDDNRFLNNIPVEDEMFVFQMPDIPDTCRRPTDNIPQYVHACFDLMYCTCMSPYDRKSKFKEDQTTCEYALGIVQKVRMQICLY